MKIRCKRRQSVTHSVMALDAQSVKWGNRQSDNGFDANKKVKDLKRNIVVDRNGFILGRYVSSAGIHDSWLASPVCVGFRCMAFGQKRTCRPWIQRRVHREY